MPSFQSLLKPCYDALFSATTVERPVALSAGGRNYRSAKAGRKKEGGRSEGGGGREPRPRLHSRRPAFADRPSCRQSKNNSMPAVRTRVAILRTPRLLRRDRNGARVVCRTGVIVDLARQGLRPSPEQARDERHHEQYQEDEKQDFGDLRGTYSNATESEHRGDQRNDKKYQRIVKHL